MHDLAANRTVKQTSQAVPAVEGMPPAAESADDDFSTATTRLPASLGDFYDQLVAPRLATLMGVQLLTRIMAGHLMLIMQGGYAH